MRLSKKDKKDTAMAVSDPSGDEYPHGLKVRLDHESMKKLGMDELPQVGKKMHVHGKGVVTSVSSHKSDKHEDRHVEIQLHHMGVEHDEPKMGDTIEKRYKELKGK
jgi:hypothetical protein